MTDFRPTAYVKTNCPFSFKFRLFIAEAGLSEHVTFVALDPDAPGHAAEKSELAIRVGHKHTFPVVETELGIYRTDSDDLIDYFAEKHGMDPGSMNTLQFYKTGLFPTFLEMFHVLATPLGWVARFGRKPKAFR